jgi:hypothetical protein
VRGQSGNWLSYRDNLWDPGSFLKDYSIIRGNAVLSRKVIREFLNEELKETEIPNDIFKEVLVETFCKYVEDDYYEWLKDNFKSFFN